MRAGTVKEPNPPQRASGVLFELHPTRRHATRPSLVIHGALAAVEQSAQPAADDLGEGCEPLGRPPLVLIPGGREAARRRRQPAGVYRRRRVAVLALVAVVMVGIAASFGLVGPRVGAPEAPAVGAVDTVGAPRSAVARHAAEGRVVVRPGESLWQVARRLQPHGDIRPLVDRLAARNGGAQVVAGQQLAVPSR